MLTSSFQYPLRIFQVEVYKEIFLEDLKGMFMRFCPKFKFFYITCGFLHVKLPFS